MEDNFDPDVAFDSDMEDSHSDDCPYTRLGNFEALENFHKALLEADDPLDVIELVDDNRHWIVAISPFGRRFCAYRDRWLEVEEERENEEVEEEEEGRIIGDPATRHNKQELARCFNLLLEIVSHFQYDDSRFIFSSDDNEYWRFYADDYDKEKEQPPEEQTTKTHINYVSVYFDCGSHRSTDTGLPFGKLLELHQRMPGNIYIPWQFFVDQGQIQISEDTKFQAKKVHLELHDQLNLTALTTVLEEQRFPNLESIELYSKGSEDANIGGLLQQLGTFSLLPELDIHQPDQPLYTTLSVSDSTALSSLRLRKLKLQSGAFESEAAVRAFVDGLAETGTRTLINSIHLDNCILPDEGILYLLKKAPKLCNLIELIMLDENPTPYETLLSASRQCNMESTSLQYLHVSDAYPDFGIVEEEAEHYWKLNKAGRRAIQDLPSISPPGLVTALLDKAQRAYQGNGIYYMLREHVDLCTIVAECNGSDGKQRLSKKKQKTAL